MQELVVIQNFTLISRVAWTVSSNGNVTCPEERFPCNRKYNRGNINWLNSRNFLLIVMYSLFSTLIMIGTQLVLWNMWVYEWCYSSQSLIFVNSGGSCWNGQTWYIDEKLHKALATEMKPLDCSIINHLSWLNQLVEFWCCVQVRCQHAPGCE